MQAKKRTRQTLLAVLALKTVLLLSGIVPAYAAFIDAVITADNHYGFYYGAIDGGSLTLVGRNEFGAYDDQGYYNWVRPETWKANVPKGFYLYILAWNDAPLGGLNPQAWLGDFTLPGGRKFYSTVTDWQYIVSRNLNPQLADYNGIYNGLPPLAQVQGEIAAGTANHLWAFPNPGITTPNDESNIWGQPGGVGPIPGISPAANWIWHDTFDDFSSSKDHYAIFRTDQPMVPIPSTLLLLGSGLLGPGGNAPEG